MITDFERIIHALSDSSVEYAIVGGLAMTARGSSRATVDFDCCYGRADANLERLAKALAPFKPWLRGAPRELPFLWDARTLRSGLNFTLETEAGAVDLLGEVAGLGRYEDLQALTSAMPLFGREVRVLTLDGLERAKRAAGRAKDLLDLAEIAEIRRRGG